jgi:hypothetical protein
MKKFKEFISKPKEEYIFNSHGAHATLPLADKPKEEYIFNSHGAHATLPSPYSKLKENFNPKFNVNEDEQKLPKVEDSYINKNDNTEHLGKGDPDLGEDDHDVQMRNLHNNHEPNSIEGKRAYYKYSLGSADFTEELLNNHITGTPLSGEHAELHDKLKEHAFQPLKHDMETYSGVGYNIHNVKPVGKSPAGNNVYHQPTYMSSSIEKRVALRFAKNADSSRNDRDNVHIFHWHHEKGKPVGIVGKDSAYSREHEVLIPPTSRDGHHVELLGTDRYKDRLNKNIYVHHVKRIPESDIKKD